MYGGLTILSFDHTSQATWFKRRILDAVDSPVISLDRASGTVVIVNDVVCELLSLLRTLTTRIFSMHHLRTRTYPPCRINYLPVAWENCEQKPDFAFAFSTHSRLLPLPCLQTPEEFRNSVSLHPRTDSSSFAVKVLENITSR